MSDAASAATLKGGLVLGLLVEGREIEINLGLLSSQVPPSPSDSTELAECPSERRALGSLFLIVK